MFTKAIILGKEPNTNKYSVRIPLLETAASPNEYVSEAVLCAEDGVKNPYSIGDVVYVNFENDEIGKPVIVGKLSKDGLLGVEETKSNASYTMDSLTVVNDVVLSDNTTIGNIRYKDLEEALLHISSIDAVLRSDSTVVKTTYSDLKALRDAGNLIPGIWYRITDYTCITTRENTSSAGHVFDILVFASSESHLNENCLACHHEGDTYFVNNKLDAWRIWYCLDNDATRFDWADGYGIGFNYQIYYRRPTADSYGKDYPYAWVRNTDSVSTIYTDTETPMNHSIARSSPTGGEQLEITSIHLEGRNGGKGIIYRMIDEFGNDCPYDFKNILFTKADTYTSAYTFSYHDDGVFKDASLNGVYLWCFNNIMKPYIVTTDGKCQMLNFNVVYQPQTSQGLLGFYNNTFNNNCYNNTFNQGNNNVFGNNFANNTIASCYSCVFGNRCSNNIMDKNIENCVFGNYFYNNKLGKYNYHLVFGNSCTNNVLGDYNYSCTFGNTCTAIIFGSGTFGSNTPINRCRNIIIDSECARLNIVSSESGLAFLKNIHIHSGISGTTSDYKVITVDRNLSYETSVRNKDSVEITV